MLRVWWFHVRETLYPQMLYLGWCNPGTGSGLYLPIGMLRAVPLCEKVKLSSPSIVDVLEFAQVLTVEDACSLTSYPFTHTRR